MTEGEKFCVAVIDSERRGLATGGERRLADEACDSCLECSRPLLNVLSGTLRDTAAVATQL